MKMRSKSHLAIFCCLALLVLLVGVLQPTVANAAWWSRSKSISQSDLQPGDILICRHRDYSQCYGKWRHVVVNVGNGTVVEGGAGKGSSQPMEPGTVVTTSLSAVLTRYTDVTVRRARWGSKTTRDQIAENAKALVGSNLNCADTARVSFALATGYQIVDLTESAISKIKPSPDTIARSLYLKSVGELKENGTGTPPSGDLSCNAIYDGLQKEWRKIREKLKNNLGSSRSRRTFAYLDRGFGVSSGETNSVMLAYNSSSRSRRAYQSRTTRRRSNRRTYYASSRSSRSRSRSRRSTASRRSRSSRYASRSRSSRSSRYASRRRSSSRYVASGSRGRSSRYSRSRRNRRSYSSRSRRSRSRGRSRSRSRYYV